MLMRSGWRGEGRVLAGLGVGLHADVAVFKRLRDSNYVRLVEHRGIRSKEYTV